MKHSTPFFIYLFLLGVFLTSVFASAANPSQIPDPNPILAMEILGNWRIETQDRTDLEERERDLRQQFITRLLFQIEQKYRGQGLRHFLQTCISDMNRTDQLSVNQSWGSMEMFLENLNLSLKELLEPRENPLLFIQSFTEFSGISDPALMEEFAETRSYYDGRQVLMAHPLDLAAAADIVEVKEALKSLPPLEQEWESNLNEDLIE